MTVMKYRTKDSHYVNEKSLTVNRKKFVESRLNFKFKPTSLVESSIEPLEDEFVTEAIKKSKGSKLLQLGAVSKKSIRIK